jgi:uncharacterized protein (DUF1015 family)
MGEPCKPTDPIGSWPYRQLRELLDERRDALVALLNERDRRMEERFNSQEEALRKAANALEVYKSDANHFRAEIAENNKLYIQESTYNLRQRQLEEQLSALQTLIFQRMDNMDKLRNEIDRRVLQMEGLVKDLTKIDDLVRDVQTMKDRTGYVSLTFAMAGLSLLISLGYVVLEFIHPMVPFAK